MVYGLSKRYGFGFQV